MPSRFMVCEETRVSRKKSASMFKINCIVSVALTSNKSGATANIHETVHAQPNTHTSYFATRAIFEELFTKNGQRLNSEEQADVREAHPGVGANATHPSKVVDQAEAKKAPHTAAMKAGRRPSDGFQYSANRPEAQRHECYSEVLVPAVIPEIPDGGRAPRESDRWRIPSGRHVAEQTNR